MESYRLKSKVSINKKEFLVQTVNDVSQHSVVSSLFVDGEVLEVFRRPHETEVTNDEMLAMVKDTHEERKSELEQLLATYEQVIGSGDAELMFHLGTAFYYKRMYDESGSLFGAVLEQNPEYHKAASFLGMSRLEQGAFDEAIKAMAIAVELRPTFADYHNSYGEALLEGGHCKRAVEEFESAIHLNIYYADAYFNLGLAHIVNAIKREDYDMYSNLLDKTRDLFNRAALISPEFKAPPYKDAIKALESNDLNLAMNLFKTVRGYKKESYRQEFSGFYLRFLLHSSLGNNKSVAERIDFLEKEIEKNPNYVDLHHELGLCYLQQAQISWAMATEKFKEAIQINPQLKKSHMALDKTGDFAESIKAVVTDIARKSQSE